MARNPFSVDRVDRTAEAIANLGWSYLSDSEVDALNNNEAFFNAVMSRVDQIKGGKDRDRSQALTEDKKGKRGRIAILDFGKKLIYKTVNFAATLKRLYNPRRR